MNERLNGLIGTVGSRDEGIKRILQWIEKRPDDAQAYDDMITLMYEHVKGGEKEYHGYNREFRREITAAMTWLSVREEMNRPMAHRAAPSRKKARMEP